VGPPWSQPFILGEGPRVVLAPRRRGTTRGSRPQGGGPAPRAATGRRGGASRPRSRAIADDEGDEAPVVVAPLTGSGEGTVAGTASTTRTRRPKGVGHAVSAHLTAQRQGHALAPRSLNMKHYDLYHVKDRSKWVRRGVG